MQTLLKSMNVVLAVLLGVVAVGLAFVALPWFGNKALIVRSGSMEPTIRVGDLVVVNSKNEGLLSPLPISKYKEGEIIAFKSNQGKTLTTHRIVGSEIRDEKLFYLTKGDANKAPDDGLVAEENIIGKTILIFPYVGRLFAFTKSNVGFPLLVIFPALLVIVLETISLFKQLRRQVRQASPFEAKVSSASLVILIPLAVAGLIIQNSHAFFSDTATSTTNTFIAAESFGTDHIVISEVQIHGGNANEDFVELYNPTNSPVDLNGWKLRKRTSNGTESSLVVIGSGKSIPAHGFFLWANSQGGFSTSVNADEDTTANISENNSVALKTPTDVIVDQVAWGNGTGQFVETTAFPNNPATSQSVERKAFSTSTASSMSSGGADELKGNGFDGNNNSTDFVLRTASQPQNSGSATESP